jgi:thiol-disulfide isomerase/thioredoxin
MLASWIPIASLSAIALVGSGAGAAGAGPEGYFPCPVIVFFEPCPAWGHASAQGRDAQTGQLFRQSSASGATPAGTLIQSLWAEPSASPDGRGQVYVPPRAVREFLESPTPDRAEAYLAWNRERLRAIGRAAEVLASVAAEEGQAVPGLEGPVRPSARPGTTCAAPTSVADGGPESSPLESRRLRAGTEAAEPSGAPRRVSVVYAFSSWCPYSAQQTPIMAAWARSRPDLATTGILFDSPPAALPLLGSLPFPVELGSPALREQLGIRGYPTIVFVKDGVPVETLSGVTPIARLEAVSHAMGD